MTERWPLCVQTPTGSHFHQMERWGWPMWASLMQAAIRASLAIDLARRVRLEGSLSPVRSAAKEQNVCECHLVSKICCSIKINTGGSYCSKRPWVNNWWAENRNKLSVLLWGAFGKPLVPSGAQHLGVINIFKCFGINLFFSICFFLFVFFTHICFIWGGGTITRSSSATWKIKPPKPPSSSLSFI